MRIKKVLGLQHTRSEQRGCVIGQNGNGGLGNDGPGIEFGADDVHRAPGEFYASREGAFVRVEAFECR